ncbi:hypothetical protein DTO027B5_2055 [Paecilomyces variotii]|nr:hypothetical protein DTO169C6_594 [Paecilomyces variotii]KAJ9290765.1 hypothetical protein DTO021C3_1699 [Paecilomyces variotii]KAJ9325744.1 hypothetical protein DTO027B3_3388 [Paecilomyces variotii]KAJ9336052.1 hypothetical protein DTO027B5_2055 [Paecilomyces variotii]KAJ9395146.1 hypothetical protein DTO282F9_7955 [Paecilomyces variotii]
MANQVSLMAYLQHGFLRLPVINQGQSPQNTQNDQYRAADITNVGHWARFNLTSIRQQFGTVLAQARIADEPVNPSPPRPINSETAVRSRINAYLTNRITRAFRCGFAYMNSTQQLAGRTVLNYNIGTMAATPENYIPDIAIFDPTLPPTTRPNRVPGDIKPSYKWSLAQRNGPRPSIQNEFKQVLSQVNFYMKQHHARYSFILTDAELVAIRRLDRNGNLELSPSIPWTTKGTDEGPQLTVLLGLWYLGILASRDQDWFLD